MTLHIAAVVGIAAVTIAGILVRPWRTPEWLWAVAGAAAEFATGGVGLGVGVKALAGGANVYAFLIGILTLAELARSQGVFAWLAGHADDFSRGSRGRLLVLVYAVGVLMTATLSNDTAVAVLTPATIALTRRIGGSPLPFVFACTFVANAASFLLPTGNPANLLVFGSALPSLLPWVLSYGPSALAAILVTFIVVRLSFARELAPPCAVPEQRPHSTRALRATLALLAAAAAALVGGSAFGLPLGAIALGAGIIALGVTALWDRSAPGAVARHASWGVVPLVAGLLVIVAALEGVGGVTLARDLIARAATLPFPLARDVVGLGTALVTNIVNNLPVAAFAARTVHAGAFHAFAAPVLVGVDLGPNLSLSGSLATLLWLMILRREGITIAPLQFLRHGALVLVPTLCIALLLLR